MYISDGLRVSTFLENCFKNMSERSKWNKICNDLTTDVTEYTVNYEYSITKFISLQITARISTHLHPCHWGLSPGPRHHNDYDAPSRLIHSHSSRPQVHDLPDQVQRNGESPQSQAFRSNFELLVCSLSFFFFYLVLLAKLVSSP